MSPSWRIRWRFFADREDAEFEAVQEQGHADDHDAQAEGHAGESRGQFANDDRLEESDDGDDRQQVAKGVPQDGEELPPGIQVDAPPASGAAPDE